MNMTNAAKLFKILEDIIWMECFYIQKTKQGVAQICGMFAVQAFKSRTFFLKGIRKYGNV